MDSSSKDGEDDQDYDLDSSLNVKVEDDDDDEDDGIEDGRYIGYYPHAASLLVPIYAVVILKTNKYLYFVYNFFII